MYIKKIFTYLIVIVGCTHTFYSINRAYLIEIENKMEEVINTPVITEETTEEPAYNLLLEVPSIDLKEDIYNNNINKGVSYLKEIKINETVILLAHSGNSKVSYFTNLDKLRINDEIIFYYNYQKYTYIIKKIYLVDQYQVDILDKKTSNTILLITCYEKNNTKRLIIEGLKIS